MGPCKRAAVWKFLEYAELWQGGSWALIRWQMRKARGGSVERGDAAFLKRRVYNAHVCEKRGYVTGLIKIFKMTLKWK